MDSKPFLIHAEGDTPLLATAVHNGHDVREEVGRALALSDADRLREEDPFTGEWTSIAGNRIVVLRSRFEVDLNRPRQTAVYRTPEDAWGLVVWRATPEEDMVGRSLAVYDEFYAAVRSLLDDLERRHGRFVVYDLHSYNHRREGPTAPAADPEGSPEVNVGTGSMDRERWSRVVDAFMDTMRSFDYDGGRLDVRENVRFQGGRFPRWVHETYPESGCALALEIKKIYMDEWTGEPDLVQIELMRQALERTVPAVTNALREA